MSAQNHIKKSDHIRGSIHAPVVLVEYGDFECPYCGEAYPTLERLIERSKDELCFVYRHFPLTDLHPHAELAAVAAESAGRQHRFWQMHHLLYENQDRLSEDTILELAESLDLDLDRFQEDLDDEALRDKVQEDVKSGLRSGVDGTPSLFFNGVRYEGPRTYEALKQTVHSLAGGRGSSAHP